MSDQTFVDKVTVVPTTWLQDVNNALYRAAANTLKGNNTGSQAPTLDLTVAQVKTLLAYLFSDLGGSINLTTQGGGTLQAAQFPALTGDVTTAGASLATTIAALAVTYGKLAAAVTASTAQTQAGSVTNAFVTPGGLKAALLFSNGFESAEQAVTGNVISAAHGLGATPKLMEVILRNKTAEGNYSVGDEVSILEMNNGTSGTQAWVNATTVGVTISTATLQILNKTTGAQFSITTADWKIVLRAWA